MSLETSSAQDTPSAVIINPLVAARAAERPDSGTAEFSFHDIIDTLNPLQHLPLVGTVYRAITGDTESPMARVLGGILYGGPTGFLSATFDAIVEQTDGKDPESQVVAWVTGDDSPSKAAPPTMTASTPPSQAASATSAGAGAAAGATAAPWSAIVSTAPRPAAARAAATRPSAASAASPAAAPSPGVSPLRSTGATAQLLDSSADASASIAQLNAAHPGAANASPVKTAASGTSLPTGNGKYFPAPPRNTDPSFGSKPPTQIDGPLGSRASMLARLSAAAQIQVPAKSQTATPGTATAKPSVAATPAPAPAPAATAPTQAAAPSSAAAPQPQTGGATPPLTAQATQATAAAGHPGTAPVAGTRHARPAPWSTRTTPLATASSATLGTRTPTTPAAAAISAATPASGATGPGDWPAGSPTPLPKQYVADAMMAALQKYQAMQRNGGAQQSGAIDSHL
ncbi:MAG: hypothetical protein P4M00_22460 [Azospirillaceae bacterium]|nr:hypothetical protein [Azospirillaceae bacterium]